MPRHLMCGNEIVDKLLDGKLNRRRLLQTLGAAGLTVTMQPVLSRSALAATQATYFTWGGYDIPELFGPYIKKHGEPPQFATFGASEEALQKIRGGFVIDVAHPCNQAIPRWVASGMFQPFNPDKLENWGTIVPSLKKLAGATDDQGRPWFAPMDWGQTSITYRTDMVDLAGGQESWSLLWDERYSGKIGVIDSAADTWWIAAIYAGIPFEDMPKAANHEKIKKLLRLQRPLVRMYTNEMTTLEQALASGELVAAMTWNSSPVELKRQGVPVAWANPKEGALTWVCGVMMHKDAPEPDKAHDIANALESPEVGQYVIEEFGYGHSNLKAFDLVSDAKLKELGLSRNPNDILDAGKFQIPMTQEWETLTNRDFGEITAGF